jgi:hypothetical protein
MSKALALAVLLTCPLLAKTPLYDVALVWKPTRTSTEAGMTAINLLPFEGKTITLEPFTDSRPDPALIGENREKPDKVLKVTTRDQVPAWVSAQTRAFLANAGLPLAEGGSSRVLAFEVTRFFVEEGENYLGDVRLKVQVRVDGEVVWSGMAIGAAKRFGRSYKLENYHETLSDALMAAWVSLLKAPDFLAALSL